MLTWCLEMPGMVIGHRHILKFFFMIIDWYIFYMLDFDKWIEIIQISVNVSKLTNLE